MNKADRGRGETAPPASVAPKTCRELIARLKLQAHPEGGWYREWYRSPISIPGAFLPGEFEGERSLATAIHYLLPAGSFSAWHRIRSDELWIFLAGGGLEIHQLEQSGRYSLQMLGSGRRAEESLNHTVKAGTWFAARPHPKSPYSLVNCIVAPGFDFSDFELAAPNKLLDLFPDQAGLIRQFCGPGRV